MFVVALAAPACAGKPDQEMVEALRQRREGSLKVGDLAPDPTIAQLDGAPVQLLAARRSDRPLVVVFGSFT